MKKPKRYYWCDGSPALTLEERGLEIYHLPDGRKAFRRKELPKAKFRKESDFVV